MVQSSCTSNFIWKLKAPSVSNSALGNTAGRSRFFSRERWETRRRGKINPAICLHLNSSRAPTIHGAPRGLSAKSRGNATASHNSHRTVVSIKSRGIDRSPMAHAQRSKPLSQWYLVPWSRGDIRNNLECDSVWRMPMEINRWWFDRVWDK